MIDGAAARLVPLQASGSGAQEASVGCVNKESSKKGITYEH
jgi:hypothetical protein